MNHSKADLSVIRVFVGDWGGGRALRERVRLRSVQASLARRQYFLVDYKPNPYPTHKLTFMVSFCLNI